MRSFLFGDLGNRDVDGIANGFSDAHLQQQTLSFSHSPVKPGPPVNLSHVQTIEAELILHWADPLDFITGLQQYEVRYSPETIHPDWKVTKTLI